MKWGLNWDGIGIRLLIADIGVVFNQSNCLRPEPDLRDLSDGHRQPASMIWNTVTSPAFTPWARYRINILRITAME